MGTKASFKWPKQITTSLVEQLLKSEKDVNKAVLIFDSATAEYSKGYRHDHTTFGLMISKLVSGNQFRPAEDLVDRMRVEKCKVSEDLLLCICRAYARVHRPLDSIRVFDKMREFECESSEKSYVTLFDILVEENQLKLAMRFYRDMREKGFPPSVVSLNVLIKALCKSGETIDAGVRIFREMPNRGCSPDSYTYGTLINGLCKVGRVFEAKELLTEMEVNGCAPSVVTYSCLIHGFCQASKIDEAMGLLEEMKGKGIRPNVFTYSSLMDGFCKNGQSSQAVELLEVMTEKKHKPNMVTYSSLVNGLCEEGKYPKAVEILDRMMLQGLKPDAGLYGKIIMGFCGMGKFQEAANFLDEMVLGRISPNRLTWSLHVRTNNSVVRGLCIIGNVTRAFQLYSSMRTRGISTDPETFTALMKLVCNKGDLDKATRIVEEMVIDGCVPDKEMWSMMMNDCLQDHSQVCEASKVLMNELLSKLG